MLTFDILILLWCKNEMAGKWMMILCTNPTYEYVFGLFI